MSRKHYTPNDQRSIVKNPNNTAHQADVLNRGSQREADRQRQTHDSHVERAEAPTPKK